MLKSLLSQYSLYFFLMVHSDWGGWRGGGCEEEGGGHILPEYPVYSASQLAWRRSAQELAEPVFSVLLSDDSL